MKKFSKIFYALIAVVLVGSVAVACGEKHATLKIDDAHMGNVTVRAEAYATDVYGKITENFTEANFGYAVIKLSKGERDYNKVRFIVEATDTTAVQLIAKDVANNYFNLIISGWGDPDGFALVDAETNVYVVGLKEGTQTVKIKLVDLENNNKVVLEETTTIEIKK